MWWIIYRGDIQDPGINIQGTPEGTLTHPCVQQPDRSQYCAWKLQHHREGGPWPSLNCKGSIYIRINDPTLYRNIGKYNLYHVWDRVLFNTPDLKINNDNGHVHDMSLSGHAQSIPTNRHLHRTLMHTGHALNSEYVHRAS